MFASSLAPSLRRTLGALPAVLAVAAAALFWACGSPQDEVVAKTFECGADGRRFEITYGELDDADVHSKYMGEPGVAVECRICGRTDAYEVYYCPECDKWYRFRNQDKFSDATVCPEGHRVSEQDSGGGSNAGSSGAGAPFFS